MQAIVEALSEEEIESYVSGKCMYLAAALHLCFGWEISVALELPDTVDSYIGHAWCIEPLNNHCVDIDGAYPADISGWIHPGAKIHSNLDDTDLRKLMMETGGYPFTAQFWEDSVAEAQLVVARYLAPKIARFDSLLLTKKGHDLFILAIAYPPLAITPAFF